MYKKAVMIFTIKVRIRASQLNDGKRLLCERMPITVIKRSGSFLNEPDRERDVSSWMNRPDSTLDPT